MIFVGKRIQYNHFVIFWNNAMVRTLCAVCCEIFDPYCEMIVATYGRLSNDPDAFESLVCDECSKRDAPEMWEIVKRWRGPLGVEIMTEIERREREYRGRKAI
jgi:hypothetical protein